MNEISLADLRRSLVFEVCSSREEVREFIITFLGVNFPDAYVDELSTSSPVDLIWEAYEVMLTNRGHAEHVVACSRGASKTLSASIIEFFAIVHFRRQVVHMSALKEQSKAALKYLKKHLRIKELEPYFVAKSKFEIALEGLPGNSYTQKQDGSISVVAATIEAANGLRANLIVMDELDLIDKNIITEASMMGIPTLDGKFHDSLSVYLSSRKTTSGPLQELIDQAEKGDEHVRLHKFSAVDWMEKCEPKTHGEAGATAWIHRETLKVQWDAPPEIKDEGTYKQIAAYEGCRTCPAFLVCQSRAPRQTSTSPYLRSVKFMGNEIRKLRGDPAKVIAQMLNWKPETAGLVFPMLDARVHKLSPNEVYEWAFNKELEQIIDKPRLLELLRAAGWLVTFGIDWGVRHPAVVIVTAFSPLDNRAVFISGRAETGFANSDWAASVISAEGEMFGDPDEVAPDLEDAGSPRYFRDTGWHIKKKKPRTVETGVSQIRGLLWNATQSRADLVFCFNEVDPHMDFVFNSFEKWSHPTTPSGVFDVSRYKDDEYKDAIDASRYSLDTYLLKSSTTSMAIATDGVAETHESILAAPRAASVQNAHADAINQFFSQIAPGVQAVAQKGQAPNKKEEKKKPKALFDFS